MINSKENPEYYKDYREWAKDPNVRRNINIILLVTAILASTIGYNYFAESASKKQIEPKGSDVPSLVIKV